MIEQAETELKEVEKMPDESETKEVNINFDDGYFLKLVAFYIINKYIHFEVHHCYISY